MKISIARIINFDFNSFFTSAALMFSSKLTKRSAINMNSSLLVILFCLKILARSKLFDFKVIFPTVDYKYFRRWFQYNKPRNVWKSAGDFTKYMIMACNCREFMSELVRVEVTSKWRLIWEENSFFSNWIFQQLSACHSLAIGCQWVMSVKSTLPWGRKKKRFFPKNRPGEIVLSLDPAGRKTPKCIFISGPMNEFTFHIDFYYILWISCMSLL